jgi:hypothetical protein
MADDVTTQTIAPRRRVAKGPKRPQYLANQELDKFMMMFTALMGEVSALRERLDTHEALGECDTPVTRASVEAYRLSLPEQQAREGARDAMMKRVFRILLEDLEEARSALTTRDLETVLEDDGTSLAEHEKFGA